MSRLKRLSAVVRLCLITTGLVVVTGLCAAAAEQASTPRVLSLQEVLERIHNGPAMQAATESMNYHAGLVKQAGLLPNPEVSIEVDNFEGENELQNFDGAEMTVSLSQLIELGGKRGARKALARSEQKQAELALQLQKQELYQQTQSAFYALLGAQEQQRQAGELLMLSKQAFKTVAARVEAGKVSPVQALRARVELNLARNSLRDAEQSQAQARQDLAALLGETEPDFDLVTGVFDSLQPLPEWNEIEHGLTGSPDAMHMQAEVESRQSNLKLERANSIPDVTLAFGVREFRESDEKAYVAGLEFPLALFDINQGGRKAAHAEVAQAIHQRDADMAQFATRLRSAYQGLYAAFEQARTLKEDIMPYAEQANQAAQFGYREGKIDFLEALDAQRTLFEVKAQYLETFSRYHDARLELSRLRGRSEETTQI